MSDNEKDQQKTARKAGLPGQNPKEDPARPAGPLKPEASAEAQQGVPGRGDGAQDAAAAPSTSAEGQSSGVQPVEEREMQFMITPRRAPSFGPMGVSPLGAHARPDMERIYNDLQAMNDVTVVRRVRPAMSLMSAASSRSNDIIVAKVKPSDRRKLAAVYADPGLIVERDYLLGHLADAGPRLSAKVAVRPLSVQASTITLQFHVQDTSGAPQANCAIVLYTNAGSEDQSSTDQQGDATLNVPGGYLNDVAAMYVKPQSNCWEQFTYRPRLDEGAPNTVVLQRLSDFSPAGFADPATAAGAFCGWGQRLMGLPQMAAGQMNGRGVKVAIIDSGCDTAHPALTHVRKGLDYTNLDAQHMPDPQSWTQDGMGHGTHCAGVIAGNGSPGHIRGFVPEADVHVLKLFPGGAFNNLAAALHYCIENEIDVVNCSLGGDQTSEAITQLIETARQAGVALVVAAGNSSGPVQFPASVPGVMCVSAIGELGEYPDNTYHARTCNKGAAGPDGLFPANFSCQGPQVDLCAPGVAVISSVPGGGYAAWDGTSMAAPAVTGLLAMVLAHHEEFAGKPVVRNAQRVDRLYQLVASAAAPLAMPAQMAGAGLPRLTSAPAVAAAPSIPMPAQGAMAMQIDQAQLQEIIRDAFISSLGALNAAGRPPVQ